MTADRLIQLHLPNPQATTKLGATLARLAQEGDVIALVGDLGAGKTHLVRGFAEAMGIASSSVSSPTFVLVHEYEPENAGPILVHIDAYRIESPRAFQAGVWDDDGRELRDGAVTIIEWADRVMDVLPADALRITLRHHEPGRMATLHPNNAWRERLQSLP